MEILRAAGPNGMHVKELSRLVNVDEGNLGTSARPSSGKAFARLYSVIENHAEFRPRGALQLTQATGTVSVFPSQKCYSPFAGCLRAAAATEMSDTSFVISCLTKAIP